MTPYIEVLHVTANIRFLFSIVSFLFSILIPICHIRNLLRSQSLSAAEPGSEPRSNVKACASSSCAAWTRPASHPELP